MRRSNRLTLWLAHARGIQGRTRFTFDLRMPTQPR